MPLRDMGPGGMPGRGSYGGQQRRGKQAAERVSHHDALRNTNLELVRPKSRRAEGNMEKIKVERATFLRGLWFAG
jgi:hypothetical protein